MNPSDDAQEPFDRSNPWITVSSQCVYENPWIRVREDQVIRPDGAPGIYGVVHFKNRAVGVLPVERDGSVWLVGQYRYPLGAYSWEVPEGGSPEGERPEETARASCAKKPASRPADSTRRHRSSFQFGQ